MAFLKAETMKKANLPVATVSDEQKAMASFVLAALIGPSKTKFIKYKKANLPGKIGYAVRRAHEEQGVTQEEFYKNLKIKSPDKYGSLKFICMKVPDPVDTYNSVDVPGWLKYLLHGGQRKIGKGYAEDQDAVMRFFGITPEYPKDIPDHRLWCDYSYHLNQALDCRNYVFGHEDGNTYSKLPYSDLMLYYYGLMGSFLPFAETVWEDQQFWQDLLAEAKKDFFNGLDKVSYDRLALLDLAGIPSDNNSRNLAEKLLKDTAAAFTDGSLICDTDYVTFCGDVGDFAEDLKAAWDVAVNQRLQDGVEHMIQCFCRRCWALENFDKTPEGMRRMPLAMLINMKEQYKAKAMLELGERYWEGIAGAERDGNQAVSWYRKAADLESVAAEANYRLGLCFQSGCEEFAPNLSEAQSWMKHAARLGHAAAQVWVGKRCEGEKPDEAFHWFRKASEQGYAEGHYHLGRCYDKGIGTERDAKSASDYYRDALNAGHKEARYNLALCLPYEGPGVLGKEAEELLQKLVEEGHQPAMCALAKDHLFLEYLILNGEAVGDAAQERKAAEELLLRAAKSGYTSAWLRLGELYEPYDELPGIYGKDWKTSIGYYRKAADAGEAEGYYQLGKISCRLHGFSKMPTEEALDYFRKAAKLDHAGAVYVLGIYVLEQDAQNENQETFDYLLSNAARLGHQTAARLVEIFEPRDPDFDEPPQWDLLIKELQRIVWQNDCHLGINYAVEQYALAHCYLKRAQEGSDPDGDMSCAMHWLEEAAKSGSRVAKRELYEHTYQDDPESAMNWLRKAAEQGSCEAMRKMYLATCDDDPQGAVEWLRKAAAAGSISSRIALHYLEQGNPVRFDMDPADIFAEVTDEERALVAELSSQDNQDDQDDQDE